MCTVHACTCYEEVQGTELNWLSWLPTDGCTRLSSIAHSWCQVLWLLLDSLYLHVHVKGCGCVL